MLSTISYSQISKPILNNQFFILGTLSDFEGRRIVPSNLSLVDNYYPYLSPLVRCIDSILKSSSIKHNIIIEKNRTYLFSDSSAKELNLFYNFKNYGTSVLSKANKWEPESTGSLKNNILVDSTQIYSFLLGAYLRYGEKLDSIYKIQITNSFSKASVCQTLLKCW